MRSAEHSGRSDGFRVRVSLARSGRSDWVGGPRREGPKNPEEEGSVCELYLQCGADSAAGRALVDLLEQVPPTPLPTSPAPPRPSPFLPRPVPAQVHLHEWGSLTSGSRSVKCAPPWTTDR